MDKSKRPPLNSSEINYTAEGELKSYNYKPHSKTRTVLVILFLVIVAILVLVVIGIWYWYTGKINMLLQ